MMSWSIIWLAVKVALTLFPKIVQAIEDEKKKQSGRDEILKTVVERFSDVSDRAQKARDAASDNLANGGMPNDKFRRD